jgi:hypothetical protein
MKAFGPTRQHASATLRRMVPAPLAEDKPLSPRPAPLRPRWRIRGRYWNVVPGWQLFKREVVPRENYRRQKFKNRGRYAVSRPRAADDFPAIRARLEELQCQRGGEMPTVDDGRLPRRNVDAENARLPTGAQGLLPMQRRLLERLEFRMVY